MRAIAQEDFTGNPSKFVIIGEEPVATGFKAFHSDTLLAGPFADVSSNFEKGSGQTDLLPDIIVGSSVFIGFDSIFKALVFFGNTTKKVGGSLDFDYWDGVAFVSLKVFAAQWDAPHRSRGRRFLFEDAIADNFSLRIDTIDLILGEQWNTTTVNGELKYWIRISVATTLTTIPTIDGLHLEFNRRRVDPVDAHEEMFGDQIPFHTDYISRFNDAQGASAGNHSVTPSANTGLTIQNSVLADGAIDGIGFVVDTPANRDTSKQLLLIVAFKVTNTNVGDAELKLYTCQVKNGDVNDGNIAEIERTLVVTTNGVDDEQYSIAFLLDANELLFGERAQLVLKRDATGGNLNDTYTGNVQINSISITDRRYK